MISTSVVSTPYGEPYLKRLCRHFAHKIPASFEGREGVIELPFASCEISVDDQAMSIRLEAGNQADIERAESVIADHLIRMANRDEPVVGWARSTPPDTAQG